MRYHRNVVINLNIEQSLFWVFPEVLHTEEKECGKGNVDALTITRTNQILVRKRV